MNLKKILYFKHDKFYQNAPIFWLFTKTLVWAWLIAGLLCVVFLVLFQYFHNNFLIYAQNLYIIAIFNVLLSIFFLIADLLVFMLVQKIAYKLITLMSLCIFFVKKIYISILTFSIIIMMGPSVNAYKVKYLVSPYNEQSTAQVHFTRGLSPNTHDTWIISLIKSLSLPKILAIIDDCGNKPNLSWMDNQHLRFDRYIINVNLKHPLQKTQQDCFHN